MSAKTAEGVPELLDMLLLMSEVQADTLKANQTVPAVGTIIESRLDKGEGAIVTVLVQNGTLGLEIQLFSMDFLLVKFVP